MQPKRSAVSTDRTGMSPSTSTGLAKTVLNIAQIGNSHRVACLGEMGSDFQTAMADTPARFYRVPALAPYGGPATPGASSSSRADVLLWATLLDERGFPDASLRDIRKQIRFGGRLVMWAAMRHPRDGRGDLERIAGLLHSASFDSIVTRIETTNGVRWMVATGVVHPILTFCIPTHEKCREKRGCRQTAR
jgi:hypothetical protein